MKKNKFTESKINGILQQQETGKSVVDICREHGISQATYYQWKSKYSGLEVNQLKRLKELEHELAQCKRIVAEQTLQLTVLKDVIEKSSNATGLVCGRSVSCSAFMLQCFTINQS
ncbi:Insertion element ISR1 uncharacterized 10 kDa protein A3 [Fibrisoma limi BUZ 3]|uniref:Insertion element ISR1 uncharacterized 10 kDa protein A3 n=1 Tax=Fibrisoma limi BUZ 3 TaxID=1185876 RepID=I2GSU8_9BACT|nr:transposase [Fibrisoma limi]CCH56977.1 Insertion element ISR1 uncharacterized 10 kDa protein A3 [Fibrisoma limi BUZ 3]